MAAGAWLMDGQEMLHGEMRPGLGLVHADDNDNTRDQIEAAAAVLCVRGVLGHCNREFVGSEDTKSFLVISKSSTWLE